MNSVKVDKKAGELLSLMTVINNRYDGMSCIDFRVMTVDAELWATLASQLKDASKIAAEISNLCKQ
jgi:hypothetical protein